MENLINFSKFQTENLKIKRVILHRMEENTVMKKELVLLHNTVKNN